MWADQVVEARYVDLDDNLVLAARRAGLEMRNSDKTIWFTVPGVGFGGVMLFRKTARLVSAYVIPSERRKGLRSHLIRERLDAARRHGCESANLITTRPEWYVARGWTLIQSAKKHGWYWVKKCLKK